VTDQQVAVLGVSVWLAALVPVGDSLDLVIVAGLATAIAWWRKWPRTMIVAAVILASLSAGLAWSGVGGGTPQRFSGEMRLASDPAPSPGGVRVVLEIDERRYRVRAWGSAAGHLRPRLMGEKVEGTVTLRPLGDAPIWLQAQGLAGRGTVTEVRGFDVGAPHTRLANSIRRTIESGAASLDRDERSLFAGLVYGDDRQQSALTADNFQAAGLTHLLAVSGQNVAFVLAIAGPLLRRLSYRPRFAFVVAVLLLFATVTRFEPSVVRASVMTGVAAVAALVGTEVSSRRILMLAVTLLVIVDPLIVHSVAFQLSVAASAGILFWSGRVARAIPGPRMLVETLAVTASAQLAVAPLLLWRFDGLPVASLPANLLAGPVAGPVMMWGLTAGLIAGLVPTGAAAVIHWPTQHALWWLDSVAGLAAQLPLGQLGAAHIVVFFVSGLVGLGTTSPVVRTAVVAVVLVGLLHPAIALAGASPTSQAIDSDSFLWRDDQLTVVELGPSADAQPVLAALRQANVAGIDVLVVRRSTYSNATLVRWLNSRHQINQVWAPERSMGVSEIVPNPTSAVEVDGVVLLIEAASDELVVTATQVDLAD